MRRHRAGGDGAKGVGYLVRGDLEVTDGRDTKQTSERASSQECDVRAEARKSGQQQVLRDGRQCTDCRITGFEFKQDGQRTYNVTPQRVRVTIVTVQKQ